MDILWWVLVIALFITSFIALIYPILPSVLAVWGGFLIYHFLINSAELTTFFWVSMGLITLLLLLADLFTGSIAVKQFGGSKWGERAATLSIIIGTFVYPPFGILLLPFIVVIIVEYWQQKSFPDALKAAIGTLIGFLSGRLAEGILQFIMIAWFFLTIWF